MILINKSYKQVAKIKIQSLNLCLIIPRRFNSLNRYRPMQNNFNQALNSFLLIIIQPCKRFGVRSLNKSEF